MGENLAVIPNIKIWSSKIKICVIIIDYES